MTTLEDIIAETEAERDLDASIVALLTGLKQQLDEALSGATLTPAQQAKVNTIFSNLQKNRDALAAALAANTSAAPAPDKPKADAQATSVSVSSSKNPSAPGEPVTLTAAVSSAGDPLGSKNPMTGSVQFLNGATAINTANLDSTGVAAISVSDLPVGDNPITAVYSGDANNAGSTSAVLTQSVA